MPLAVRADHLLLVKTILNKFIPNQRVIAFGSRVKGTEKKTSDLDLCIIGDEPLSFEQLAALRDAFSESNIPYKVDVVDWLALDTDFQKIIEQNYEVIQNA